MIVRPLDMQVLIPRTIDVSKVQQLTNQQVAVNQQLMGEQLKQLTNHRQHQVQQLAQPEGNKVAAKKPKEDKQQQSKQQQAALQQKIASDPSEEIISNHPSQNDPVRGHSIDIIT